MPSKVTACLVVGLLIQLSAPILSSQSAGQVPSTLPENATAGSQNVSQPHPPGFQDRDPRYQLVPGDTMDLVFEFSPEFNQSVSVQPDGYINLRGVGDIHVSSLTLPQLISTLEAAYSKILNKPAISVVLKDYDKPYFVALGQVGHPGKYILHGDITVTQAIAEAGGFTDKSKHSNVVLFRRVSSEWTEAKVLDVKKMLNARNLSEDFVLHPGDMIFVPQNTMSKITRYLPTSAVNTYIAPSTF